MHELGLARGRPGRAAAAELLEFVVATVACFRLGLVR